MCVCVCVCVCAKVEGGILTILHKRNAGRAVGIILNAFNNPRTPAGGVGEVDDAVLPLVARASVPACDAAAVVAPPAAVLSNCQRLVGAALPQPLPAGDDTAPETCTVNDFLAEWLVLTGKNSCE